jgi:tRNA(Ile)-lysidine synthase
MNIKSIFNHFLRENYVFGSNQKWLVAVSGGVDSVVLCHLCHSHKIPFAMAHCNFQLRGEESERDEIFVRELAKQLDAELFVKRFDTKTYAAENNVSIQVAARELRYTWFDEILKPDDGRRTKDDIRGRKKDEKNSHHKLSTLLSANRQLPTSLATAHHADDNLETVMFNLFRGTGIRGIRGILPVQGSIIRPMLEMQRVDILQYAKENGLSWVEDSSNVSDKYSRNFIRNQVLPMMKEILPSAEKNFTKTMEQLREAEILYEQAIDVHKKKLLEIRGNEVHIPILKLAKAKPLQAILFEMLKPFHFTALQTEEAIALMESETGSFVVSASHRIFKNRNWLIIAPLQTEIATNILIEKEIGEVLFPNGKLNLKQLSTINYQLSTDAKIAMLDSKEITFPLILRPWKQGDYFYPLGMQKKKKLSKFFIDQKLSKTDKEKVWVIESNKKILWVVGHRIDNRFKCTEATKALLELRFRPSE